MRILGSIVDFLFTEEWAIPLPIDSWWFCAVVLIVLVFAIWLIARLTTSVTEDIDPAEADRQMLTAVAELKSRGELSSEEFRSIKGRLVERLSDEAAPTKSADSTMDTSPQAEAEEPEKQINAKPEEHPEPEE